MQAEERAMRMLQAAQARRTGPRPDQSAVEGSDDPALLTAAEALRSPVLYGSTGEPKKPGPPRGAPSGTVR